MKPIMKIKNLLIVIIFGIFLQTCDKTEIIPPEAEIVEISDITDTSASFKVILTSWSNAQDGEHIKIWIDTLEITLFSPPLYGSMFLTPTVLDSIYTVTVTGLYPHTHYYSRIYYDGLFDIGGPTDLKMFLLGEQKEFTTLP